MWCQRDISILSSDLEMLIFSPSSLQPGRVVTLIEDDDVSISSISYFFPTVMVAFGKDVSLTHTHTQFPTMIPGSADAIG